MSAIAILFWFCVAGILYTYAGYPALIGVMARWFPKPVRKAVPVPGSLTILISIYNEAHRLADKLDNILSAGGADRIRQILVGSDGSTDHPEQAMASVNDPRIELVLFPERRGKPSVLNDLLSRATGEILVMMDVRQRLDPMALPALVENFADPAVGVVSGELVFERSAADTDAAASVDAYWRYEKWLRDREGRYHSVPGATGALYAIRRELVKPIPPTTSLDDVLIPMYAIAQGARCIFEPRARIYDRPSQDPAQESVRKRRTLAGCVQLLRLHPRWCLPGGHPIWWQFASHKIARLFCPFLMAGALAANGALAECILYRTLLVPHLAFYMLGAVGLRYGDRSGALLRVPKWVSIFLVMQWNALLAWRDGLRRRSLATWTKSSA